MNYTNLAHLAPEYIVPRNLFKRSVGPAGALLGAAAWAAHPVLGAIGGYAAASNAIGVLAGDKTPRQAAESLGAHVVAAASSLALPVAPMIGYGAGSMMSGLVFKHVLGEEKPSAKKPSESFFNRRVEVLGGQPVWKVALGGIVLLGVGYGVHKAFGNYVSGRWLGGRAYGY